MDKVFLLSPAQQQIFPKVQRGERMRNNKVTVGIRGPTPPRGEVAQTHLKSALLYFLRLACMCLQEHSRSGGLQC